MTDRLKYLSLLGTRFACLDYAEATEECIRMSRSGRPAAVSTCDTQTLTVAKNNPAFSRSLERFDLILPDSAPLVWALNWNGAALQDRVFGPYFMRHVLQHAGSGTRHFFFGGTEEALSGLAAAAREWNPEVVIAGTCSPPDRNWTEDDEAGFARRIWESGADFIWVVSGGEWRERWIADHIGRHARGVFVAVGDSSILLPGGESSVPGWMRSASLSWLCDLVRQPVLSGFNRLKSTGLFLYYLVSKKSRDRALTRDPAADATRVAGKFKVGFLGSRGVPAQYSGFETVVEELGGRLAARGHEVTVYNRMHHNPGNRGTWKGMRLLWYPTIPTKNLESIVHSSLCLMDAIFRGYDILYVCGVGNTPWSGLLARMAGRRMVVNVDGADFKRKKWGKFARWWLRRSEQRATRLADAVIADNQTAVARYRTDYGFEPLYLTYGAPLRPDKIRAGELERWGLEPGRYILHVSRLTPENETDLLLKAHARMKSRPPLVVVGSAGYEEDYQKYLYSLVRDQVIFTGGRFGDAYVELSQHAAFFVMPATIEATRLVLLDQMGMGKAILYHDCPASREVLADAAEPFRAEKAGGEDLVDILADKMSALYADPGKCGVWGERAWERARTVYSWDHMVDRYEELFEKLCRGGG